MLFNINSGKPIYLFHLSFLNRKFTQKIAWNAEFTEATLFSAYLKVRSNKIYHTNADQLLDKYPIALFSLQKSFMKLKISSSVQRSNIFPKKKMPLAQMGFCFSI